MRYFTIRASNINIPNLLEVDILANQLIPLFRRIESYLKIKGIFNEDDELIKRLVPEYDLQDDKVQARIQPSRSDWGDYEYGVYILNPKDSNATTPLTALSMWFYSPQTKQACSITMPLKDIFSAIEAHVLIRLIELKKATTEDKLTFSFFLRGHGEIHVPVTSRGTTLTLIMSEPEISRFTETEKPDKALADIFVEDSEPLIKLQKHSSKDYSSVFHGILQRGDLRIFIKRTLIDKIWKDVESVDSLPNGNLKSEVGGLLFGNPYEDDDGKIFVDISGGIFDNLSNIFSLELRRYPERINAIISKNDNLFLNKQQIGWFHSHLFQTGYAIPIETDRGASYAVSLDMSQFSSSDRELHSNLFPLPWQVALVVKNSTKSLSFYQWKRGKIEPCQGYYIYE